MAQSPSHKFGQIIGHLLEDLIGPFLANFAEEKGLYLDYKGKKRPARQGKKVVWEDHFGNKHDLDYVIEKNASDNTFGIPVAFIEAAWRRYTKHSRNKAQEIQGAILPLAERFRFSNPFLGVVLAGYFTEGSLKQFESHGFKVLYFSYDTLVDAFANEGIEIAFDEATSDSVFGQCVKTIEAASDIKIDRIKQYLIKANEDKIIHFMEALEERLNRMVDRIVIIPLYGRSNEFLTFEDAIEFLNGHRIYEGCGDFRKYEIIIKFSNGDSVEGSFQTKVKVLEFLRFISRQ